MSIKHTVQSAVAEGSDPTLIGPNEWNSDHAVTLDGQQVSANYAVQPTDEYVEITANSPTITLPDATSAAVARRSYYFLNSGTGAPVLQPVSSQLINGDSTYQLVDQWQFVKLYSNGSAWRVIGTN